MVDDDWLTTRQLAAKLGLSDSYIRKQLREGRLPAVKRYNTWHCPRGSPLAKISLSGIQNQRTRRHGHARQGLTFTERRARGVEVRDLPRHDPRYARTAAAGAATERDRDPTILGELEQRRVAATPHDGRVRAGEGNLDPAIGLGVGVGCGQLRGGRPEGLEVDPVFRYAPLEQPDVERLHHRRRAAEVVVVVATGEELL